MMKMSHRDREKSFTSVSFITSPKTEDKYVSSFYFNSSSEKQTWGKKKKTQNWTKSWNDLGFIRNE